LRATASGRMIRFRFRAKSVSRGKRHQMMHVERAPSLEHSAPHRFLYLERTDAMAKSCFK